MSVTANAEAQQLARPIATRTYWNIQSVAFLGLWLLLMAGDLSGEPGSPFRDPGTLWHSVVGQHILSSHSFIYTDPFSCTHAGEPWIARQWLFESAMGLLDWMSGLDGLLFGMVTLLAGFYTWLVHRFIRAGVHPLLAVLLVVLAMVASSYHFHMRPHLVTLVLLGWTFAQLCDFEAGKISVRSLFWLVPVFIVWTNAHDGVLGGLATIGLAAAGWGFLKVFGMGGPVARYRQLVALAGLVAACALTSLVSPYGLELPKAWLSLLHSSVLPQFIGERAPVWTKGIMAWRLLLFACIYLAALAGVLPQRPRVTWLIPLAWLVMAILRVRHGPLFAATAALALADMLPHVRWIHWLARKGSQVCRLRPPDPACVKRFLPWRPALIPIVWLLATALLQITGVHVPVVGRGWARLEPRFYPVELIPDLQNYEHSRPSGTPIFNEMLYGGFLIYYSPGLKVFIDDRCELYGDDGILEYVDAETDPKKIGAWVQKYRFERALTKNGSGFDAYFRNAKDWKVIAVTESATLYGRDDDNGTKKD